MKRKILFSIFSIFISFVALVSDMLPLYAGHNKKHTREIEEFNQQTIDKRLTIALFNLACSELKLSYDYAMEFLYYWWIYPQILGNKKSLSKVLIVDSNNKTILNITDLYKSEIKGSTDLKTTLNALQKVRDETRKLANVPKIKLIISDTYQI